MKTPNAMGLVAQGEFLTKLTDGLNNDDARAILATAEAMGGIAVVGIAGGTTGAVGTVAPDSTTLCLSIKMVYDRFTQEAVGTSEWMIHLDDKVAQKRAERYVKKLGAMA